MVRRTRRTRRHNRKSRSMRGGSSPLNPNASARLGKQIAEQSNPRKSVKRKFKKRKQKPNTSRHRVIKLNKYIKSQNANLVKEAEDYYENMGNDLSELERGK